MWFLFSLIALLFWSGADIFNKIGSPAEDRYSHWKIVMAVGLVMGLHAGYSLLFGGVTVTFRDILVYLPVSAMYILSMTIGYIGLRYIELSICSPICNASGAVSAVLCFLFLGDKPDFIRVFAVALVAVGILLLGYAEMSEDDAARQLRQEQANRKYAKSWLALSIPLAYCAIDALGTFFDCVILREEDTETVLDSVFPNVLPEEVANVAYELTFLFMGVCAAVYVLLIRRDRLTFPREYPKLLGGVCETAGQFFYVFAIGSTANAAPAVAIISAYCALSVLWSRIFLKEKLSWKHYVALAITFAGIVTLGFFDA